MTPLQSSSHVTSVCLRHVHPEAINTARINTVIMQLFTSGYSQPVLCFPDFWLWWLCITDSDLCLPKLRLLSALQGDTVDLTGLLVSVTVSVNHLAQTPLVRLVVNLLHNCCIQQIHSKSEANRTNRAVAPEANWQWGAQIPLQRPLLPTLSPKVKVLRQDNIRYRIFIMHSKADTVRLIYRSIA